MDTHPPHIPSAQHEEVATQRILLLGANGRTGRQILRRSLTSGHAVTALVRSADRLADVQHANLQVHVGSATDPQVLRQLLPGHDVLVSVLGPRWPTRAATAVYSDSGAAIVSAMQGSDVKRVLVTSSGLLFEDDAWSARLLRWLVPHVVHGAAHMEQHIRTSGLDWTIARTSFLNNDSVDDYRVGEEHFPEHASAVSRTAVAAYLLGAIEQAQHVRTVVGLCG